jgi:hypothetical protein
VLNKQETPIHEKAPPRAANTERLSATKLVLLAVDLNFRKVLPHASVLMMMIVKEGTQRPAIIL